MGFGQLRIMDLRPSTHTAPGAAGPRPAGPRTETIYIRPFVDADARPMFEAARESMEELCAWMTWCRPDYTLADARAFVAGCAAAWERGEHFSFAILDQRTHAFLGSVGINTINPTHKFANLGYWIRTSAKGRGFAPAAVRSLAALSFREFELNRLEILIPEQNLASQRVAEKAGARFEALLRNRLLIAGKCHDAVLYSILPADLGED